MARVCGFGPINRGHGPLLQLKQSNQLVLKTLYMDNFSPSDLKTILHSKRANIYYLEHCRVLVNGGRVEYVTDEGKRSLYWNIPIANTTTVMLGTGTSITQAAMRELAKAGVMVGFCGGGGTPLYSANEIDVEFAWFSPQSEYRPTEYLQNWVRFWFSDELRLEAAKSFQRVRLRIWSKMPSSCRKPLFPQCVATTNRLFAMAASKASLAPNPWIL